LGNNNKSDGNEHPIVIIGAGTIGLFLAHELMRRGERIIIIEAGGDTIQPFHSNEYENVGHSLSGISIGRTKGIGGTSNLWGGQLTEFIENDIDENGCYGQPKWLIAWDELNKYYQETYKKLGFKNDWNNNKQTLTETGQNEQLELFYTRWIKQPNFKFHFLDELRNSGLVTIIPKTIVTNLHFKNGGCDLIEIIKNGKKDNIEDFKCVILANGTIEICRLLLNSMQSDTCPYARNSWVGKYFQDHINLRVGQIINPSKTFFNRVSNVIQAGEKLQPKIRIRNSNNDENYLGISGIFTFDNNVAHHIDNIKQFSKAILGQSKEKLRVVELLKMMLKMTRAVPQIILIIYNYIKNNRIYVPYNSKVTLAIQAQQISNPDSNISLSTKDCDDYGRPKALVNWHIDGREFIKIRAFCDNVKKYLNENEYGDLEYEKWFETECSNPTGDWVNQVFDSYHQAGGAIMSESDEYGVVDKDLKIHKTRNAFVCGACALPTSSSGNTGLTALALAYRLADHLTNDTKLI